MSGVVEQKIIWLVALIEDGGFILATIITTLELNVQQQVLEQKKFDAEFNLRLLK